MQAAGLGTPLIGASRSVGAGAATTHEGVLRGLACSGGRRGGRDSKNVQNREPRVHWHDTVVRVDARGRELQDHGDGGTALSRTRTDPGTAREVRRGRHALRGGAFNRDLTYSFPRPRAEV